jgi:hypothetical protein
MFLTATFEVPSHFHITASLYFPLSRKKILTDAESFFGAFAKLRKATTGFVMSVRSAARKEQLGSP